ncbi:MAG TPA: DUF1778 domain-containing protein [Armatimonadota bacterium]|nr:DUF1778 domain-containing protein [Armatimonadota bacterium]
MPTARVKSENLSCRVSPEHKKMIERAARRSGFSVSDFVIHTLVTAASDVLHDDSTIRLTKEEWDRFTRALERPAREPDEATKRAVSLYRKGRDEGDRRVWRAKQ